MSNQYMKTLFDVYVGNYELMSGVVMDGVGDLEWTIDKMLRYGVSKEHVADFVYDNWNDPHGCTDWHFSDSDPFTVTVSVHCSTATARDEAFDGDIDDETRAAVSYALHEED